MGSIAWIVLGLIAGIRGRLLLPGRDPGGWLVTSAPGHCRCLRRRLPGELLRPG